MKNRPHRTRPRTASHAAVMLGLAKSRVALLRASAAATPAQIAAAVEAMEAWRAECEE